MVATQRTSMTPAKTPAKDFCLGSLLSTISPVWWVVSHGTTCPGPVLWNPFTGRNRIGTRREQTLCSVPGAFWRGLEKLSDGIHYLVTPYLNRLRSSRLAASGQQNNAGKGSRQIRTVTLGKSLAPEVRHWDVQSYTRCGSAECRGVECFRAQSPLVFGTLVG